MTDQNPQTGKVVEVPYSPLKPMLDCVGAEVNIGDCLAHTCRWKETYEHEGIEVVRVVSWDLDTCNPNVLRVFDYEVVRSPDPERPPGYRMRAVIPIPVPGERSPLPFIKFIKVAG